jgi:hypothetical protein
MTGLASGALVAGRVPAVAFLCRRERASVWGTWRQRRNAGPSLRPQPALEASALVDDLAADTPAERAGGRAARQRLLANPRAPLGVTAGHERARLVRSEHLDATAEPGARRVGLNLCHPIHRRRAETQPGGEISERASGLVD